MITSFYRGHAIYCKNNIWYYSDTDEPTVNNVRKCGYCEEAATIEGHDACLGTIPDIMNACCGHGIESDAYIQFNNDKVIRGKKAIKYIKKLKYARVVEWNTRWS